MNQGLFSLLITQIWQVGLLFVLVWVAVRIFAADRPHLAHALWVLVLVKCITPPIWSSPVSPFSWMASDRQAVVQEKEPEFLAESRVQPVDASTGSIVVNAVQSGSELPRLTSNTNTKQIAERRANGVVPGGIRSWTQIAIWIWLGGACLGLVVTLVKFGSFVNWIRRSLVIDDPNIAGLVGRLAKQLGVKRRVRVRVLDRPVGPAVIGLLRPTILLPVAIVAGKPSSKLEPLLAHELIHVRRGDLWWAMVQTIASNLFWFHPLVWIAVRMVTRESERSCDEETVTSLGCRPAAYARGLLEVLEHKHQLRVAPALPGVRPVDITSARLERVMKLGNGSHRRTPVWVWLVMLVCGTVVLPGAAMVLGQDSNRLPVKAGPDLPLVEAPLVAAPEAEWRLDLYYVGDLLKKLREFNQSEAVLLSDIPVRRPGKDGAGSTLEHGLTVVENKFDDVRLGNDQPNMKIVGDNLYVYDTPAQHRVVAAKLAHFRKAGVDQILVEVRFVSMPMDQINKLGLDWSIADSTVGRAAEVDNAASRRTRVSPIGEASGNQTQASLISDTADPVEYGLVTATSVVEKSFLVLHATINDKQVGDILKRAKGDIRSNIMQAPTVTMFNRREAMIKDVEEHPFVVGQKTIKDSGVRQPVVRVVESGVILQLKPVLTETKTIQLTCNLTLSSILSVDTVDVTDSTGKEPFQVQVPEVESMKICSSMEVPVGETIVLKGSRRNAQGANEVFMTLVTCRLLSDHIRESKTEPAPAAPFKGPKKGGIIFQNPKSIQPSNEVGKPADQNIVRTEDGARAEHGILSVRTIEVEGQKLQLKGQLENELRKDDEFEIERQHLPLLNDIPYIGRLFKNVGIRRKAAK